MDKKTLPIIIALALLIIFYYPLLQLFGWYKSPEPIPNTTQQQDTTRIDSLYTPTGDQKSVQSNSVTTLPSKTVQTAASSATTDTIIIKTKQYEIVLSSYGGGPVALYLNEFTYRNGQRINMLTKAESATPDFTFAGETFSTSKILFTSDLKAGTYEVTSQPLELIYRYTGPGGGELIKRYRFYPDNYHYDLAIEIVDREKFGFERQYQIVWNTPLGVTEPQPQVDFTEMKAVALMAGSRVTLDKFDKGELNQSLDGQTSWAGVRSKYFASVLIPRNRAADRVFAHGRKIEVANGDTKLQGSEITVGLSLPFANVSTLADSFRVFVGPLDYELMAHYKVDLEDMLGIGTTPFLGLIIKPFALGVIWLLPRLHDLIPNYGVVIMIFAMLVKVITLPLSMKSFKSMQAMKDLQPKIEELKQQHKKNPQALNQEMMKLYKSYGVNPLSGCLPMLPQMPLFFALFSVFRSTILLRNAPFVWFIDDLSRGANSFTDPYIVLVLIMVAAQFFSQKLTIASTQQNKMFTYIMPFFMGFIFYRFAAGLVLYWTCFSIFSLLDYVIFKRPRAKTVVTP